eukprot:6130433-Amphidinium_carterae.2
MAPCVNVVAKMYVITPIRTNDHANDFKVLMIMRTIILKPRAAQFGLDSSAPRTVERSDSTVAQCFLT